MQRSALADERPMIQGLRAPGPGLRWPALVIACAHLALVVALGKLRIEHLIGDMLLLVLPWLGPRCRLFVALTLPAYFTGVLFDNQPLLVGLRGEVHTGDLYLAELALFPAPGHQIWSEWFTRHSHWSLDLLAGIPYMTYLLELLAVAVVFFFVDPRRYAHLVWGFLCMNVIGMLTYILYPAAPPWYVMQYGLGPADLGALPSAAGALRFDALLGIEFFARFYSRNPNVFGAMPSLHCATPMLIACFFWRRGGPLRLATAGYLLVMCFAAVYLAHHYLLDVLAGLVTGLAAYWLGGWLFEHMAMLRGGRPALGGHFSQTNG
jgi:membrane-associated phospholipid phosphatase